MVLYGFPHKLLVKLASFFLKAKSLEFTSEVYISIPLRFRLKRKSPLCRGIGRGVKKKGVFIYINKCDVQFGVLQITAMQLFVYEQVANTDCKFPFSYFTISVWVVPDIVVMMYPITQVSQFSSGGFLYQLRNLIIVYISYTGNIPLI